jgi:hypothetical protein
MPKTPKHPRAMTTEEAAKHLFHPELLKHPKLVAHGTRKPKRKKK